MDEATVESRNRFFDLLSTFSALRSNGQALIDQIRGSLDEMRELRTRLRHQQGTPTEPGSNGGGNGHSDIRHLYGLTSREAQVASLLIQGQSNSAHPCQAWGTLSRGCRSQAPSLISIWSPRQEALLSVQCRMHLLGMNPSREGHLLVRWLFLAGRAYEVPVLGP
jgi:hypothetical protein